MTNSVVNAITPAAKVGRSSSAVRPSTAPTATTAPKSKLDRLATLR